MIEFDINLDRATPLLDLLDAKSRHEIASSSLWTLTLHLSLDSRFWQPGLPRLQLRLGEWTDTYCLAPIDGMAAVSIPVTAELLKHPLQISSSQCSLTSRSASAVLAPLPPLDDGNLLIIAPHPDDAEIAAGGLYTCQADRTRIVTLSAGEQLKSLDKQYIPGLDEDIASAMVRKGEVRSWNSSVTPLLSGVPKEHSVLLGVPDGKAWDIVYHDVRITPAYSIQRARRFNSIALPGDDAVEWQRELLIAALISLIELWRPTTIVVTDPEFDTHSDHKAAALAVAHALQESTVRPHRLLLYANHYQKVQPPGPAFQPAWTPPRSLRRELFVAPSPCLIPLSLEEQRQKALLLDAMTDLSTRKPVSRWRRKHARFERPENFALGRDRYFSWAIRSGEYFQQVSPKDFIQGARRMDAAICDTV